MLGGGRSGQGADHGRAHEEAEGQEQSRGQTVENAFGVRDRSERHDTHLSVGTPGEGGVFI